MGLFNFIKKKVGQTINVAKKIGGGVAHVVEKAAPIVHKIGDVVGNVAGVAAKGAALLGQPEFAAPLAAISKGAHAVGNVAGAVEKVGHGARKAIESKSLKEFAGHARDTYNSGRNVHQAYRGGREDIQHGRHAGNALAHYGHEQLFQPYRGHHHGHRR